MIFLLTLRLYFLFLYKPSDFWCILDVIDVYYKFSGFCYLHLRKVGCFFSPLNLQDSNSKLCLLHRRQQLKLLSFFFFFKLSNCFSLRILNPLLCTCNSDVNKGFIKLEDLTCVAFLFLLEFSSYRWNPSTYLPPTPNFIFQLFWLWLLRPQSLTFCQNSAFFFHKDWGMP